MKISKSHDRRKRRSDSCSDCGPTCDCPDCSPFLLGPTLLGLLAIQRPGRPARSRPGVGGVAGTAAIRGYQRWVSPRLPTRCRHRPTCSEYGVVAVRRYGLVAGARLTAGRIRRCDSSVVRGTADPVP